MPHDATPQQQPCITVQVLTGKVSDLERWQRDQNGILKELKEMLASGARERQEQYERMRVEIETTRKEAVERMDKLLYWIIAFAAGCALTILIAYLNHAALP